MFTVRILVVNIFKFPPSIDGSCLLWVMSTEISVDIAGDIVVDIEVDTRSIVSRHSVDTRSILGGGGGGVSLRVAG